MAASNENGQPNQTKRPQHRRRGKALEADILASTLKLIETVRYEDLTMDMIAQNAHTNKSVLYRRWDAKSEIVLAALRTQIGDYQFEQPDTGSFQGDFEALFETLYGVLNRFHYRNMMGLMRERLGGISMRDFFEKIGRQNYLTQMVRQIFEQAAARNELDMGEIDEMVLDLPVMMLGDMLYGDDRPLTRERFENLLQTILMPVFRQYLKQR